MGGKIEGERGEEHGRRERGLKRGFKSLKFYSAFSFIRTMLYIDLLDWSYITDLFLLYRVFSKNVFLFLIRSNNPCLATYIAARDLQSSQRNVRVQSLLLAGHFLNNDQ